MISEWGGTTPSPNNGIILTLLRKVIPPQQQQQPGSLVEVLKVPKKIMVKMFSYLSAVSGGDEGGGSTKKVLNLQIYLHHLVVMRDISSISARPIWEIPAGSFSIT